MKYVSLSQELDSAAMDRLLTAARAQGYSDLRLMSLRHLLIRENEIEKIKENPFLALQVAKGKRI